MMEGIRQGEKEGRETGGSRVPFTEEETETISEYFSQHIAARKPPYSQERRVKEKIRLEGRECVNE